VDLAAATESGTTAAGTYYLSRTTAGKLIPIYDPGTTQLVGGVNVRQPFANNVIPSNRISPISKKFQVVDTCHEALVEHTCERGERVGVLLAETLELQEQPAHDSDHGEEHYAHRPAMLPPLRADIAQQKPRPIIDGRCNADHYETGATS
jgi:hypothetical protein